MFKKTAALIALLFSVVVVGLTAAPASSAPAPAVSVSAPAVAVPQFSPCSGYCVNVQNMYWSLNTNVQIGICDLCGPYDWNWLLNVGAITSSTTPDVNGYYIGSGWCAKEFNSYGENVWSENPNGPIVGPRKVTLTNFPWNRVYAYQAQAPWGCNF